MPITIQRQESHWLIGLEGQVTIASAAELRELLLEWLAAGKDLELDLTGAEGLDIAVMQLLWAGAGDAARTGAGVVGRMSEAAIGALRDAGFARLPGFESA
jgi:anti-anti-sigma regulatory factor